MCDISTFPFAGGPMRARHAVSYMCDISTFPFVDGWDSSVIFRLFLCQRQLIPLEKWKARGNSSGFSQLRRESPVLCTVTLQTTSHSNLAKSFETQSQFSSIGCICKL